MRLKVGLILIACLYTGISCETESNSEFKDYYIKYYGSDGDQQGVDLVVNSDGTIVILGNSEFNSNRRIYLVKTDSDGDVIWEKLLGEFTENAKDIEPILSGPNAGGYLILSNTEIGAGNTVIKVIRVDADGDKIDSMKLNAITDYPPNFGNSITSLSNGGFIVVGNTSDASLLPADDGLVDPPDDYDLLSLRYDDNLLLDPSWQKSFGGEPETMGIKVFEISSTQFDFAGYTNAVHSGESTIPANYDFNFWFVKLDGSGSNGVDDHVGNATDQEKMSAIAKSASGPYISVGTVTNASGVRRIYAARILGFPGSDKTETWDDNTDPEGEGVSVSATNGGKFLIVGNQNTAGGSRDIWLTKVNIEINDEEGFPRSFGSSGNDDTASAVAELPNGDIVVLGTMNLTNQNKIALIKLKASGDF